MVEGHSVHRVAKMHRDRLVGKRFVATSPNGRFKEGAAAINNQVFHRIEAVGKNLFAFFGDEQDPVVVHVHFGMAGAWAVYNMEDEVVPDPTATNRLRMVCLESNITADLSAMTVQHGGIELYELKRSKLGQDPLRSDADVELLWQRVSSSKKSIGALIMDQSFFTGPGNIYRAEILFKAGIHPDTPGKDLERRDFDCIWQHTVSLLQRGFVTGSILTVDPEEAKALGMPNLRRYIYNQKKCPRCATSIRVWEIAARTCYACPTCQPLARSSGTYVETRECVPFVSHCAREPAMTRLAKAGASNLTVAELRAGLADHLVMIPSGAKKKDLVHLWESCPALQVIRSPVDAAADKAKAGESMAVEHIAELAPAQARRARAKTGREREVLPSNEIQSMSADVLREELTRLGIAFPTKAGKSVVRSLLQDAISATTSSTADTPRKRTKRAVITP